MFEIVFIFYFMPTAFLLLVLHSLKKRIEKEKMKNSDKYIKGKDEFDDLLRTYDEKVAISYMPIYNIVLSVFVIGLILKNVIFGSHDERDIF